MHTMRTTPPPTPTDRDVRRDPCGAAIGVACHHDHRGNTHVYFATPGYWQCAGCGTFRPTADVLRTQGGTR